jgi:hypothetical protein
LTDSELNREIAEHQQLLAEAAEGTLAQADLESAIATFLLEREERQRARRAAIDREVKCFPEPRSATGDDKERLADGVTALDGSVRVRGAFQRERLSDKRA